MYLLVAEFALQHGGYRLFRMYFTCTCFSAYSQNRDKIKIFHDYGAWCR